MVLSFFIQNNYASKEFLKLAFLHILFNQMREINTIPQRI